MNYPDGLYDAVIQVTAKENPSQPFVWEMKLENGVWFVKRPGWFHNFVWEQIRFGGEEKDKS